MSTAALVVGYIVFACGGVALICFLAALTMDYFWTVIKRTHDFDELGKAMRFYEKHKGEYSQPEDTK